jgi:competence protein ComEC
MIATMQAAVWRLMDGLNSQLQAERERWLLWLPALLAVGIGLYFHAAREPDWHIWLGLTLLAGGLWAGLYRLAVVRATGWLILIPLIGFAASSLRTHGVAATMLTTKLEPTTITGRLTALEPATSGWRGTLTAVHIKSLPPEQTPQRLQMKFYKLDPLPSIGDTIRFFGTAYAPNPPAYPGAVDFRRMAFFQGIGGQGFAMTPPTVISNSDTSTATLWIARLRRHLSQRYDAALPPAEAGLAKALLTGERANIPKQVNEDFRASGLYHLLSISGLHMTIVGGWVFVGTRALLALIPWLSSRFSIKSIAALLAIASAGFYWLLAGGSANVPAERSFLGFSILMLAIILRRQALSLRTLALVASLVLLLQPEMLLSPGFQMSFAASAAIVALYEGYGDRLRLFWQGRGWWAKPLAIVTGLLATSLAATLATTPIAFAHFQQTSLIGIVANIIAVPLTELVVMPIALLSIAAMPLGLEQAVMPLLGYSIDLMLQIAAWGASLPGAILRVNAWSPTVLLLLVLGGLWMAIWQRSWRLWGTGLIAAGILLALLQAPPTVMLANSGKLWLVRLSDGSVALSSRQKERGLAKFWLAAQGKTPEEGLRPEEFADPASKELSCSSDHCRLQRGSDVLAWFWQVDDAVLAESVCAQADTVVLQTPAAFPCPARQVISWSSLQQTGTQAIWWTPNSGRSWRIKPSWPSNVQRPWSLPLGGNSED